ncbi:MAG: phosphoribosylformylglycinamidine synthase [Rhodospirillaceae bacterium]|nr:phosphoribosylformylglycinamidine synthase [Rhodospirillaceae bacterium]|tara:strand:- start:308 stop:550 length:243 start_codon:yes stop_codon:yes gene_type:complete
MKAKIFITLKDDVLDPQGKAISKSLKNLGFEGISDVRQGKLIEIKIDNDNKSKVFNEIDNMCKKLLANTVVENYKIEITE